jgi:hypothetical protein
VRLISLTQGKFAKVDDADFDWLNQWKWCAHKWEKSKSWYAVRNLSPSERTLEGRSQIKMHQALMPGVLVDHRDLDGLNNQRHNLRAATRKQNAQNCVRRSHSQQPLKGVRFRADKNKWQARIVSNGKEIFLGYFLTMQDAALAYNQAAISLFGEFARINPI